MGLLRLLLALSVITGHSGSIFGYSLLPAQFSVLVFFILSGFYMSLVINEKYDLMTEGLKTFYKNRFLRLYPTYFVVLCATVAIQNIFHEQNVFFNPSPKLDIFQRVSYIALNLAVFGQDIVSSFDNRFHSFPNHPVSIGWTIGTEALFYVIAPFVVKRKAWKTVLYLALASLAVRLSLLGFRPDPSRYRVFPSTLIFFLMGYASYLIYKQIQDEPRAAWLGKVLFWGVAILVGLRLAISGVLLPDQVNLDSPSYWIIYITVMYLAPFLFAYTKNSKIDNYIGQITYPIYICHNFVIYLVKSVLKVPLPDYSYAVVLLAAAFGIMLHTFVERPINVFRVGARKI